MELSSDLISQFVKITNDKTEENTESTIYGTAVVKDGSNYVMLDGSDQLTPITTTTDLKPGERVTVTIKDHKATVTGNISSPAARTDDVQELETKVAEINIVIADKVSTGELEAEKARIDDLEADNVTINGKLEANEGKISELETDNLTINESLQAVNGSFDKLNADYGSFKTLTTDTLTAVDADIKKLDADKLSVEDAEIKYASIDFANIDSAAMEYFYANSGLIKNVVVGDESITGELVGVTIKGDLIEGGTVVADKLVIKGTDGLYYKLNTNGTTTETEQTDYNSLNGSIITAKSITASKVNVEDLVAFDATIGGFNITDNSIYSGVKSSVDNTTKGIYLDNDGQVAFGDSNNFIKYYKDTDGKYKLDITAETIHFGSSGKTVEEAIEDVNNSVDSIKDELTTFLYIDSSRGTVFKNDNIATVLSVIIYRGSARITDMETLRNSMGDNILLRWKFQRMGEDRYWNIDFNDPRISNDGFVFTLTSDDIDVKATFICELITEEEI